MSKTLKSPELDQQLKSLVDHLSLVQVEALAHMRLSPVRDEKRRASVAGRLHNRGKKRKSFASYILARRGEPKSFADELIQAIQAKAKARLDEAKAGPLPDEPEFNEETMQVLRDARDGNGLVRYGSWDDLFDDLGI